MQDSHRTLYCTKTWYHLYISGGLQKMLTDLFNLVWNTQKKSKWTIFFECPVKMFLSIKKVLEKISEHQPYCFSPHFLDKGVTFLLSYNLRNIIKQNWH